MRSLIILEVEHGEDTDFLESMVESAFATARFFAPVFDCKITDYTVRVDLPECFVLD